MAEAIIVFYAGGKAAPDGSLWFLLSRYLVRFLKVVMASSHPLAQKATTAPDPVDSALNRLFSNDFEQMVKGSNELNKLGTAALPALLKSLETRESRDFLRVLGVLDEINDRAATSDLVRIVERSPDASFSLETEDGVGDEGRALYAREVLAHLWLPESRNWEGASYGEVPGTEAFARKNVYDDRVRAWYKGWIVNRGNGQLTRAATGSGAIGTDAQLPKFASS